MRKSYLEPEMELLHFYLEDVVCSSPIVVDTDEHEEDIETELDMG